MKNQDIIKLNDLRQQGKGAAEIAETLNLPLNTVKSYLRRHPEADTSRVCPQCGKPVVQKEGRKEKKFCSDKCRMTWWNSHQSEIKKRHITRWCASFAERSLKAMGTREGSSAAGNVTETTEKISQETYSADNLMAYRVSLSLIDSCIRRHLRRQTAGKHYTIIAKRHGLSLDSIFAEIA